MNITEGRELQGSTSADKDDAVLYAPASFWIRSLALILDLFIVTSFSVLFSFVVAIAVRLTFTAAGLLEDEAMEPSAIAYFLLLYIVFPATYFGLFCSKIGATPGKLAFGLKVVRSNSGQHLGILRAYFRETWLKAFMFLFIGTPFLFIFARKDRRGLHDLVSDSCVLRRIR